MVELAHLLRVKAALSPLRGGLRPALTRKCCQLAAESGLRQGRKGGVRMMQCDTCFREQAHYHIIVEQGKVTQVWYVSSSGYWDRELEQDEYFVEYKGAA
jgi:hypothetical protein